MKRFIELVKGCPLFCVIVVSAVLIAAVGWTGAAMGIYKADVSVKHSMIETVLTNERAEKEAVATAQDAVRPQTEAPASDDSEETEQTSEKPTESTTESRTEDATDSTTEKTAMTSGGNVAVADRKTKYRQVDTRKSRNDCYRDVSQIALETDYPYIKVDKSYFDNALFIGDSRVEGLALYSGLDNADFAYKEGLTTFGVMTEKIASDGTQTLPELLGSNTYAKIYIMLGINEAGYATDSYAATYADAVRQIQELQPDAVIFIMGCIHVTSEYSDANDVINNDNIDDKNGAIAGYADGVKLFYLDVNTVLDDENGGLIKDYTWDDIHLQAQYYSLWENYLYERGLKEDAFSN